jgi:3-hydroxyisobutyrate dehydrogenase-like beta-hydroxyacid dehydrogenase
MTQQEAQKIKIGDKDYLVKDLSDDAKAQIQSLQFCEQEIARLNAKLAVAATARNAYQKAVAEALPKEDVSH